LQEIRKDVLQSGLDKDHAGILRWEGRFDELVEGQATAMEAALLSNFADAYYDSGQAVKAGTMYGGYAECLQTLNMFREQVEIMRRTAWCWMAASDFKKAIVWYSGTRDHSAQHGFPLLESAACIGLGRALTQEGRIIEAVAQQRRALAVALSAGENTDVHVHHADSRDGLRLQSLRALVDALCAISQGGEFSRCPHLEEAESLLVRLREGGVATPEYLLWNHSLEGSLLSSRCNYSAAAVAWNAAVRVAKEHPEMMQNPDAAWALQKAEGGLRMQGRVGDDSPPLSAIAALVFRARDAKDSDGVLKWESRLEEMITVNPKP
jgi:tetratricopeptide (TPR) repeat protein